jgi:hypothetical protein
MRLYLVVKLLTSVAMYKQIINNEEQCRQYAGDFGCRVDQAARCGVHHPMEHILGFTRSHWMLPPGECLHASPRRLPWLTN